MVQMIEKGYEETFVDHHKRKKKKETGAIFPCLILSEKKRRDLTQSYDKSPYTNRKIQKATWQHKKRHQNFDYM